MCLCVCVYAVQTMCKVIYFKAPNTRCCIINIFFGGALCLCVFLCITLTWHHGAPQPTSPSGPPHGAFCSEIIPHRLVLYLPQLHSSLTTPTFIPRIPATAPAAPALQPAGVEGEAAKLACPSLLMPSLPRRSRSLGCCWLVRANPQISR